MVWVRISDDIDEHPKTAPLSDSAFALFVASLAYCNRNLTDGFIPSAVGLGKLRYCEGNAVPAVRELETVGLWGVVGGGWIVHDYHDYQPTKESVLKDRASTRYRVQKHRSKVVQTSNVVTNGPVTVAPVPVPVPKDLKTFDQFWSIYPRKVGKPKALTAYRRARARATDKTIIAGTERYRDDPNRTDEYTAHPTTWLNRDGWDDAPLPSHKNGSGPVKELRPYDHVDWDQVAR